MPAHLITGDNESLVLVRTLVETGDRTLGVLVDSLGFGLTLIKTPPMVSAAPP
mgnify:CR=1 FL=1